MPGSDIVVSKVLSDGSVEISDRFATAFAKPTEDYCSHWSVVSGTEESGVTTVELIRKLDTGDSQDRPIVPGVMKVSKNTNKLINRIRLSTHLEHQTH